MEERFHKRTEIQIGCWILGKDGSCCCTSFDISDSGISLRFEDPLDIGQVVCLQFYTPQASLPLSISAEVVWSRTEPDCAMGLKFLDITREELACLHEMTRCIKAHAKRLGNRLFNHDSV